MVESLKELNKICQKPRYREVGNLMVRYFFRDAALPITWLVLHTNISANQVSIFSVFVAVLGVAMIGLSSNAASLTGALLLQFWYLLDHVDGQVARYRKTSSLTGRFLDFMMHHFVHAILFFGLALYAYGATQNFLFIIWGFFACISMAMFNVIYDTMYKTFFERILSTGVQLFPKRGATDAGEPNLFKGKDALKILFSILHKSCEIHIAITVLTVGALLSIFSAISFDFRLWAFYYYGIAAPMIAIGKIAHFIRANQVDVDYQSLFTSE